MVTRISSVFFFKTIFVFVLLTVFASSVTAAPYKGDIFEFSQPDGTSVLVRVWGDEFYHRVESLDGYTVIRDRDNRICYARLSVDARDFEATGVVYDGRRIDMDSTGKQMRLAAEGVSKGLRLNAAGRAAKVRAGRKMFETEAASGDEGGAAGAPLLGSVIGLTICVDFVDEAGYFTTGQVDDYLNLPGYGMYGSVRDYFYDVSGDDLTYTNVVTGYYTALYPKGYYDDPARDAGYVGREIVGEALDWLESQVFDFTQISVDSSNRMLAINVFYAGTANAGWSNGLWPHKWSYTGFTSSSGIKSYDYQITSMGTSLVLRTFCHENGHMICGWPDLYDYGYESNGVGNYCLMGYGGNNANPVPPNAYFRHLKGWDFVTDITNVSAGSLYTHTANSNTSYIYRNESYSNESFYIESRMRADRNSYLPDEGLVVWHVDSAGSNNNEQMTPSLHYLVSVEQADGLFQLENDINYGGGGDLFHAGYKDSFTDSTNPDAKWWDGSESGLGVVNIGPLGSTMSFKVNNHQSPPTAYNDIYSVVSGENLVVGAPGVLGNDDDPDGDTLSAVLQSDPSYGSVTLYPDGSFTYVPNEGFIGTDSFTYIAQDLVSSSNVATVYIDVGVTITSIDLVVSENTVSGTVTEGSYGATHVNDSVSETITESISGRNPKVQRSGLEHIWEFDLVGGDSVTFRIEASGIIADGSADEFEFAYSTDGSNYTAMLVTSGGVLSASEYALPSGTSGTVFVRVQDTDSSKGETTLDSISVDYMCIESETTGIPDIIKPNPNPMEWAVEPYPTGSTSISMTAKTATDDSGVEYYFTCTAGGGHDSGWQLSPTYVDTGLTPETSYTYTVTARDRSPNQNETEASTEVSATTDIGGSEAYINSTLVTSIRAGKNHKGQAVVTVLDSEGGVAVSGRTVTGNWYFPDETTIYASSVTAVTDGSGIAVFVSAPVKVKASSRFTFEVTSVDSFDGVTGNTSGYVDVP